jgi:hypothetical protein
VIRSLILLFTFITAPLFAQSTFPELLAEKPDPKFHDKAITLGQLAGAWTWEGSGLSADGTRSVTDKGQLTFHWILDGRAMQDVWMETERSDGDALVLGTTVRFYDPKTDTWRATWLDPGNHAMKAITGRRAGDDIVFEGTSSDGTQFQWIFSEIKPDSFRWHAERLIGGKWVLYEDLRARRRPVK